MVRECGLFYLKKLNLKRFLRNSIGAIILNYAHEVEIEKFIINTIYNEIIALFNEINRPDVICSIRYTNICYVQIHFVNS